MLSVWVSLFTLGLVVRGMLSLRRGERGSAACWSQRGGGGLQHQQVAWAQNTSLSARQNGLIRLPRVGWGRAGNNQLAKEKARESVSLSRWKGGAFG